MKLLLLDVYNNELKEVQAEGLDDYYKLIGCETVDIVYRKIGNVHVNVICDDEGRNVENPKISAIDITGAPCLVGNLLIAGKKITEDGELTDITNYELTEVYSNIAEITTKKYPEPYRCIVEMDY